MCRKGRQGDTKDQAGIMRRNFLQEERNFGGIVHFKGTHGGYRMFIQEVQCQGHCFLHHAAPASVVCCFPRQDMADLFMEQLCGYYCPAFGCSHNDAGLGQFNNFSLYRTQSDAITHTAVLA
jgi:hypothetical protein